MKQCCKEVIEEIFEEIDRRLDENKTNCITNDLLFSYENQMFRDNLREEFSIIRKKFLERKALEEVVIISRMPSRPKIAFRE